MEIADAIKKLIELKNQDEVLRSKLLHEKRLNDQYHPEMEQLHLDNTAALQQVIDTFGLPTVQLVGKEANNAAWYVVQHSISSPQFMIRYANLLEQEDHKSSDDLIQLAYLKDRIAVFQGNPQLYGTQFDWDENGEMSPQTYDNLEMVNKRRLTLGINTLEEQTLIMRKQVADENQEPPANFEIRKAQYDKWRKSVGWNKSNL